MSSSLQPTVAVTTTNSTAMLANAVQPVKRQSMGRAWCTKTPCEWSRGILDNLLGKLVIATRPTPYQYGYSSSKSHHLAVALRNAMIPPDLKSIFITVDQRLEQQSIFVYEIADIFAELPKDTIVKYLNSFERTQGILHLVGGRLSLLPPSWIQAMHITGAGRRALLLDQSNHIMQVSLNREDIAALVRAFPNLESISLRYCNINSDSDAGVLKPLTELKQLTSIDLTGNKCIANPGIAPLAQIPLLEELILDELSYIDHNGIAQLASLQNLIVLSMNNCRSNNRIVQAISTNHPRLKHLHLNQTQEKKVTYDNDLTNEGLQLLGELTALTFLDLSGRTGFTDDGLAFLEKIRELRELRLCQCEITGVGIIKHISRCQQLQALSLEDYFITVRAIRWLPKSLVSISLVNCSGLTGECIEALDEHCPKLERIRIENTIEEEPEEAPESDNDDDKAATSKPSDIYTS